MKDLRNLTERTMEFFRYMEDLLIKNNAGSIRIFDSFPNYLTPGVGPVAFYYREDRARASRVFWGTMKNW